MLSAGNRRSTDIKKLMHIVILSDTRVSEAFSLLICLDATKFILLSVIALLKTICLKIWGKPLSKRVQNVHLV